MKAKILSLIEVGVVFILMIGLFRLVTATTKHIRQHGCNHEIAGIK